MLHIQKEFRIIINEKKGQPMYSRGEPPFGEIIEKIVKKFKTGF